MATKKSSKPGAVKYFNDLKAQGYKNAAKAMKAFKMNMPKAQLGEEVNNMLINKPGSGAKKGYGEDEYSTFRKKGLSTKEAYDAIKATRKTDKISEDEKMYRGLGPAKKGGAIKTKKKK